MTLPLVCVPMATGTMCAATAAAERTTAQRLGVIDRRWIGVRLGIGIGLRIGIGVGGLAALAEQLGQPPEMLVTPRIDAHVAVLGLE